MATQSRSTQARPRLGRGISSLISNSVQLGENDGQYQGATDAGPTPAPGDGAPAEHADAVLQIGVEQIATNPFQPRRDFHEGDLRELADSIARQGVLQPLIVTKSDDADVDQSHLLIAGERRLRAARLAGLEMVPCVVREATRQQMLEWALVENIHRADLNPIERAQAYRSYVDRFGLTHSEAAERLAQPRTTVSHYLRILDLCESIQQMIASGTLSFGHGKVLAALAGQQDAQELIAKRVIDDNLSVRDLEQLLAERSDATPAEPGIEEDPAAGRRPAKPPYIRDLEEQLTQVVGTRVLIRPGRAKNTGKVVIDYYSLEDFDRIGDLLGLKVET